MALLSVDDLTTIAKMYRIPAPVGENDTAELEAVIDGSQAYFLETFSVTEEEVSESDDCMEALKHWTFAQWLRWEMAMRTPIGVGAVQNLTEAQPKFDDVKFRQAWNRACSLMGRDDVMIVPLLNI